MICSRKRIPCDGVPLAIDALYRLAAPMVLSGDEESAADVDLVEVEQFLIVLDPLA